MRTQTKNKIIEYIRLNRSATVKQLGQYLHISPQSIHRQLNELRKTDTIRKIGSPPKVYYILKKEIKTNKSSNKIEKRYETNIVKNYFYISPDGIFFTAVEGFKLWCERQNLDISKTAKEYYQTIQKFHKYKNHFGFINGFHKLKSTFKENTYLNELYYVDFYSIERFGKTRLGSLVYYGKQSQNTNLIEKVVQEIEPKIEVMIKQKKIDAVGFIPPTVPRKIQFMNILKQNFHLKVPIIDILKVVNDIAVPQKSLKKLEDRILNIESSVLIQKQKLYDNILLIDDAVGSGATLNITAKKIKLVGMCKKKVIGLAITGSFKGFEVFNEV